MLQSDSVQSFDFDFPPPPTLGEFVFALSLLWLIMLTMIAVGSYGLYRSHKGLIQNGLIQLLVLVSLTLGFGLCFVLGVGFTPINHHRFAWSEDDQNINYWINTLLFLMVWGTSPLSFWVGRKFGKRGVKLTEPDAN